MKAAFAGWTVDCGNYCFFNEIQPNCQGVYWLYNDRPNHKGYTSWNSNQNGCLEVDQYTFQSHIIYPNQITCNCGPPKTTPPADKSMPMSSQTRDKLELLRAQVHAWTPCAPSPANEYANIWDPFTFREVKNCQSQRKQGLPRWYISARGCFTNLLPWSDNTWHPCTFDGDQSANTSASCLAGNVDLCNQIKDAQDPITGAWYRNAYMRRHPETTVFQPSFSRDQMLGMLGYWIQSKNKTAVLKWLNFLKGRGKTAPWGGLSLWNLCPPRPNIPKPPELTDSQWAAQLPDDRCAVIPEALGLIYSSALHAGVTQAEIQAIDNTLYNDMVSGYLTLDPTLYSEAATVPALGSSAYQLGDTFDGVYIRMKSGGNNSTVQSAAQVINNRSSKLNPMYHYLAEGKATEYGAYLIRKYCTAGRPNWGFAYLNGWDQSGQGYWLNGGSFLYTGFQYAGGVSYYGDYEAPIGHDCLTLLNMYLGNGNLTELRCNHGDQLINGACLKYPIDPPVLAPIYGIDYKIQTWDAKLSYMAIDQSRCPYGGVFQLNPWPARCLLASGLTPADFRNGITYWVDPNPNWPGIFYSKIKNACPYGGVGSGPNCQLKSYAAPYFKEGVSYWVDPNPSWPGIYYAKVSNACPYGGVSSGPNCQIKSFTSGFLDANVAYFTRSNHSHPGVYYYPQVVPETYSPIVFDQSALKESAPPPVLNNPVKIKSTQIIPLRIK